MKIACFADLHLTDNFNTVKLSVLRWALDEARKNQVDLIALLGDMTAVGTARQAEKILAEFSAVNIPFCSTCGNAEYRSDHSGKLAGMLDIPPSSDTKILMVNSASGTPQPSDLERITALPPNSGFLLLTHVPPTQWHQDAQEIFQQAQNRRAVTSLLAGHSHEDSVWTMRGLDPDKAAGNPPGLEIVSSTFENNWQRQNITMPQVDPASWNDNEKAALRDLFGIAVMYQPIDGLRAAVEHRISHVELRYMAEFPAGLPREIDLWRQAGGKTLSMHLTNLDAADSPGLAQSVDKALQFGCDRVTLHVPRTTPARFQAEKSALLDNFDRFITPLMENNITIGIENLHTRPGERDDHTRNYGCNIQECRSWIMQLREKYPTANIGFHCDIGHARNNAPFSSVENLSDYYCEMGKLINGWHFHQVIQNSDGSFKNHRDLTGFFTKLISLGGFLLAYKAGQLNFAPIFLEVTTPNGSLNSWKELVWRI